MKRKRRLHPSAGRVVIGIKKLIRLSQTGVSTRCVRSRAGGFLSSVGAMRRAGANAAAGVARLASSALRGGRRVAEGLEEGCRNNCASQSPGTPATSGTFARCRMPRWERARGVRPSAGSTSRALARAPGRADERARDRGAPGVWRGLREFASVASGASGDGAGGATSPSSEDDATSGAEPAPMITAEDVELQSTRDTADVLRIFTVVRAIRNRGHFAARLDPLGRSLGPLKEGYELMESTVPEDGADIAKLLNGFPNDLYLRGRKVNVGQYLGLHDPSPEKRFFLGNECKSLDPDGRRQWWTVEELMTRLRAVYCGTLSAEFNHIASNHRKNWLRRQLEGHVRDDGGVASTGGEASRVRGPRGRPAAGRQLTREDKRRVLRRLIKADALEGFLARNFPSAKRFGLEGAEALIPGLQSVVESAAAGGAEAVVVGMAHRGRLNVLNNVFGKPLGLIATEMRGESRSLFNVGDVRYHLGTRTFTDVEVELGTDSSRGGGDADAGSGRRDDDGSKAVREQRRVEMSMAPNPSHLEAVNSVVAGMVRSKQMRVDVARGGRSRASQRKVLGLLIHGDAAFCGLGVNAEVMQLQDLPDYTTGGTVHIVVNNQIGFTTVPRRARSSPHPSDVAKGYGAPIFHVNGDDPEAVVRACRLAADFRAEWGQDVVINLVCYRRLGHNEQDDPSITLPLLSERIKRQRKVSEIYADRLVADGVATRDEVDRWIERCAAEYQAELDASGTYVESPEDWAVSTYMGQRDSALNVGERLRLEKELRLELDANKTLEEEGVIVEDGPGGPRAVSQEASSSGNGDVATTAGSRFESIEGLDANPRFNPRMFSTGVPLEMIRAVGHAMTELPPENLEVQLPEFVDGADLDDIDDETARTKAEKDYGVRVGDSVRTAKALLSQLDDVARKARLEHMGLFPPDFIAHPHTRKLLENRRKMVEGELGVDWGTAELLAFATLVLHRYPGEDPAAPPRKHCHVRLSGQDVERGTFNHRHSVLYCSRTSRPVNPIDNMGLGDQDRFLVCNSPLSEHAVMGFEYGFSVDSGPAALVLWEAQFGDFANNAQGIVDQFVATGEAKWGQRSGLVLLLPHGYDGNGPDHSSARPERWLAAASDDPDSLPGRSPRDGELAAKTFAALREKTVDKTVGKTDDADASGFISLDRLRERVEALEAAAESAPAEENVGFEVDDSNDQAFTLFDEHGALIDAASDAASDAATSTRGGFRREPHDARDRLVVEPDDFRGDDDDADVAAGKVLDGAGARDGPQADMDPIALASAAVKASRARSMYDDVRRFFRRDRGRIDRVDWDRYMRHRAKTHADSTCNFVLVNPSTPANYFHALRRQANVPHVKPLVVLAPKYLLHHRPCASPLRDFGPGSRCVYF